MWAINISLHSPPLLWQRIDGNSDYRSAGLCHLHHYFTGQPLWVLFVLFKALNNVERHEIASSPVFFWMDFSCLVTKDSSWKPSSALKQHSFVPLVDFWGDHYALKKRCEKVCTAQPHTAQKEELQTEANSWDEGHSWLNSNRKILTHKKIKISLQEK